jgi:hypothetical protein
MPRADTQAMQYQLEEIASNLAPKAHAIVVLDQAGWHTIGKLRVPENLSLTAATAQVSRVEPGRERLAISSPEETVEPDLRQLWGDCCRGLRCLEQPRRRPRSYYLDRNPPVTIIAHS